MSAKIQSDFGLVEADMALVCAFIVGKIYSYLNDDHDPG